MAEFRLYCLGESGNAYKVALMLNLAGCDWEPVFVNSMAGETRNESYRADINVQGEIPVLDHAGLKLTQSGMILDYLAAFTGKFGPRDEAERREILRWILFDNHKFTSYYATLRFLYGLQKTGETPVTEFLRSRVIAAYGVVDAYLAGRDFILGDRPTIADISMAGYVYYPEETGIGGDAFPNVARWKERIAALPGWAHPYDLMPRGFPA